MRKTFTCARPGCGLPLSIASDPESPTLPRIYHVIFPDAQPKKGEPDHMLRTEGQGDCPHPVTVWPAIGNGDPFPAPTTPGIHPDSHPQYHGDPSLPVADPDTDDSSWDE